MVVLDASVLLLLLRPEAGVPIDPATGEPVPMARERIDYLIQCLEKARAKIIIPTPALSEVLVRAGTAGPRILEHVQKSAILRIAPFDTLAAIEVAAMTRRALDKGDKRGSGTGPWAKIKYDRQIVAIAKVEGASTIYSDDDNIKLYGRELGVQVVGISDLDLPPSAAQAELTFPEPEVGQGEED